jgi:predicted TPR repeat methyltransferase
MHLRTLHPLAFDSYDHTHPKGTMQDNTHAPQFVSAVERIFDGKILSCDLGCAGGGLVKDFIDCGHEAVGVEGSDYSRAIGRAEWATIPKSLFTADITKPFNFRDDAWKPVLFDLMTAWEVLEHITEEDLPGLFDNLQTNLRKGGLFVASIATFEDEGYHVTLKPAEWWRLQFEGHGFEIVEGLFAEHEYARRSSVYLTARKAEA